MPERDVCALVLMTVLGGRERTSRPGNGTTHVAPGIDGIVGALLTTRRALGFTANIQWELWGARLRMQSTETWARPALRVWTLTQRFQKFLVVGAIGLVVNQGMLYLLVNLTSLALAVSSPISIVVSMIVTFTLNELWTWHDRGRGRLLQRAMMYGTINSGGLLINAGVLLYLHGHGVHYLFANLVGAGLAAIWNFGLNNMLTWRK